MAPSHSGTRHGTQPAATTSFLLANLHCPTCVSTIKSAILQSCPSQISWVSPNVVTSVVTVEHDAVASIRNMAKALDDAGFEVVGATSTVEHVELGELQSNAADASPGPSGQQQAGGLDGAFDRWMRARVTRRTAGGNNQTAADRRAAARSREAHLANCEQCRKSRSGQGAVPAVSENVGLAEVAEKESVAAASSSQQNRADDSRQTAVGPGAAIADKPFVTVDTEDAGSPEQQLWRASLAVGGMTCAACVNTISEELKQRDYIDKVAVNLVSNSATVEFRDKANVDKLVEAIEDLGYEAHVDNVVPVVDERQAERHDRTVEIHVDGFYCEHCPDRVVSSITVFRGRQRVVEVLGEPTMKRPVITVRYVPNAPDFTVRHLLAAIDAADPAFTATIHHPPTLEERSRQLQARHQRQLLMRVIFTLIVCVPTFVIGIVYMSLLPDHNEGKHFMMQPWTSGISRAQIALFIMATPVYFFAADIFHVRAFKEVRVMWRRGSTVPLLRRFYRFGSMDMLISLGTTIAYISSLSQLIAAAVYRPEEINDSNFYFDSVVFLAFFLLLGRLIETYSKSRTGDAVEMLGKLRPTTAILVVGGAGSLQPQPSEKESGGSATQVAGTTDVTVAADQLDYGDVIRIPHGSSPACDGVVLSGSTVFDESSLTGESRPVKKDVGDAVFSGTVNNGNRSITARVTGPAGQSMLDKIVAVVREGQAKRAPMERVADALTTYFVPLVTLVAILTWIIWLSLGLSGRIPGHFLDVTSGGWVAFSLQFAIAVFVVACPCGLALAAPTAIFVGGGLAAKYGILAKGGGEAFETASKVDVVVFDKTGTLTEGGRPKVTDEVIVGNSGADDEKNEAVLDKETMLAAIRAIEENSSHPIAKAIVLFCTEKIRPGNAPGIVVHDLEEIPGKGMKAVFEVSDGRGSDVAPWSFDMAVGNEALLQSVSAVVPARVATALQGWKSEAKSVALVAVRRRHRQPNDDNEEPENYTVAAALAIADPIRRSAPAVVSAIRSRGLRVWMLSGDNEVTARAVAARVGIDAENVIAGVLPEDKAAAIKRLQSSLHARDRGKESTTKRAIVAMVGDGVNDSPALTTADVGIAVGSGSDVAISSAGFVLVPHSSSHTDNNESVDDGSEHDDLTAVVTLLDLSRVVFARIRLNFAWALVYNMIAVPVAGGALYPVKTPSGAHVRLDPVWASLAMALSSISVVLSSLALRSGWPILGFRPRRINKVGEGNQ